MSEPFRIFIGYDASERVAYHVLAHSIIKRASRPVSITPVSRQHLSQVYMRDRGPLESTDFSISRFLVPYLSGYKGYSLFMDCDMLMLADVMELWNYILQDSPQTAAGQARFCPDPALWCCQHSYDPSTKVKMDKQIQTRYGRKNWSSFMIFNNERCRVLTPEYVNTAEGLDLHQFRWLKDGQIAQLPLEWNWLNGEYPQNDFTKNLHYTLGGPWFPDHASCPNAALWYRELADMTQGTKEH